MTSHSDPRFPSYPFDSTLPPRCRVASTKGPSSLKYCLMSSQSFRCDAVQRCRVSVVAAGVLRWVDLKVIDGSLNLDGSIKDVIGGVVTNTAIFDG